MWDELVLGLIRTATHGNPLSTVDVALPEISTVDETICG
jgi:hypothetical protein